MSLKKCLGGEYKRKLGLAAAVFIFALVALFYHLAFNSSFASSVAPNSITGNYIYYTANPTMAVLPLDSEAGSDEAIAVFSTTGSAFAFASYNTIEIGSTATTVASIGWVTDEETSSTTLSGTQWIPGEQNYYYVTVTDRDEEYVRSFDGVSGDPSMLRYRGRTLRLQQICIVYDNDDPVIDNVSVVSSETIKSTDELKVSFEISDGISGIRDETIVASINGNEAKSIVNTGGSTYEAVFPMSLFTKGLLNGDTLPDINLSVSVEDIAGNSSDYTRTFSDTIRYDCLEITNISMFSDNERAGLAKRGDTVTLSFETSIELTADDFTNARIAEKDAILSNPEEDGKKWLVQYTIAEDDVITDNSVITAAITIENNGITKSITQEQATAVKFYNRIGIKSLQFTSSNEIEPAFAIKGDTITVIYEAAHPVIISNAKISGKSVMFSDSGDGLVWTASYTIPSNINKVDGSEFTFEFEVKDEAGNPSITVTQSDTSDVIIFSDDVDIINLKVVSNNPKNTGYARVGDIVTITFTTQKPVLMWPWPFPYNMIKWFNTSTIAERSIRFENMEGDYKHWKGEIEITPEMKLNDGVKVPFFFQIYGSGIRKERDENSTTGVIYYDDNDLLKDLVFESSNKNPKIAKDGDDITVSFNTKHRVSITDAKVAGETVALTSRNNNGKEWTGSYKVENGKLADESKIYFELSIEDNAGHTMTIGHNEDMSVQYLAPLEVTNLNMVSNNDDPTLAKNDDVITVSFETQHYISRYDAAIAGKDIAFTSEHIDGKWKWRGSYTVENRAIEDQAMVLLDLNIYDIAGNSKHITQDDLSTGVQYFAPIKITDFNLLSDNSNTSIAKNDDVISTVFTTQHPVTVTKSLFAGKEAVLESDGGDGMTWSGSYTVAGGDTEDEGIVTFDCSVIDKAGNTVEISQADSNNSVRYLAPIEIVGLSITSSNTIDSLAKVGDLITVTFNTQHKVNIGNAKIAGQDTQFRSENDGGMVWTGTYRITDGIITDGALIDFTFTATDDAGNITETTQSDIENNVTYFGPIQIKELAFTSSNSSKKLVKVGNTLTLSFKTQHEVQIVSAKIAGRNVSFTSQNNEGKIWSATTTVSRDFSPDNSNIPFVLEIGDICGNAARATNSDTLTIKYYAPIEEGFSGLSFTSDNSSSGFAKDGTTVVVKFKTTHPVSVSGGRIAGRSVSFGSSNDMDWSASLTMEKGQILDNSDISFTFDLMDAAGNDTVSKNQGDTTKIRYYAPIDQALSGLKFTSDNINSIDYAKNGNTVSLYFTTTHPVSVSNSNIAGRSVTLSSTDEMHWSASYQIKDGEIADNTDIKFSLTLSDKAGNPSVTRNQDSLTKVRYQAPIKINELNMVSNNKENLKTVARDGDTVSLSFNTTHPVMLSSVKIADQYVSYKSLNNDNMHWSAEYIVANGHIVDNQEVALHFIASDIAGNTPVTSNERNILSGRIMYYAPIIISDLVITTDNSSDGRMYAKDGDTVTVRFTTNHDVALSNTYISGRKATVETTHTNTENNTSRDWVLSYKLQNGDISDLAEVTFNFDVDDIAGNNRVNKKNTDSDVTNKIKYYAPLEAETAIASNGSNAYFAKNGDSVTVTSNTNHDAFVTESRILARPTSNSGVNGKNIKMTYTIPENETGLTEGPVPFEYLLADSAGNTISISDSTVILPQIIYDRTNPNVAAVPDFSGFTNQMLTFRISYRDTNIDPQRVSLKVNGVEQITAANRNSITGTEFIKEVAINLDGEYLIEASMVDKAGNKSNPDVKSDITVDTTNPEIKHVNLELGAPRTYKAGFNISEYFSIDEKYVKEVISTVADNYGVSEWDIYAPITTDGKKTIYLMVTDMAGNNSAELTYDLYIDGTPPKPIVMDTISGAELLTSTKPATFVSDLSLKISLDKLHIGDEEPDYFTELKLLDKDKNIVVDLLETVTPSQDGVYTYTLESFGEYTFVLSASDSVGNVTGACEYGFIFKDKTVLQKFFDNKPIFYSSSAGAGVLAIGSVVFISIRRRRKIITAG